MLWLAGWLADWLLAYLALTLTESGSIYIRVSVVITYNVKETGGWQVEWGKEK